MRFACLWVVLAGTGAACAQGQARPITLHEAQALAVEANASFRAVQSGIVAAEGEVREAASPLFNNPEVAAERATRRARDSEGAGRTRESSLGLSQRFEIAGQQGHRRSAARHAFNAALAERDDARLKLRAEVEAAFLRVLILQRRLESEEASLALALDAASAVAKRVAAGEDSRLDGNLSAVEAERARSQVAAVREKLIEARALLAHLIQAPAGEALEAVGEVPETLGTLRLETLLERAAERPLLRALIEREASAGSRLALERAAVMPDITVGLDTAREGPPEMRERVTTLSVSVPLPLFNRNQAAIGRARAELDRARIERQAAVRDGEAAVRQYWQRLASLESRLRRLASEVLPRLDENLGLSTKAYRAGELGILQLIVVNRQALDARREYLEALAEFSEARVALQLAGALPPEAGAASPNPARK